MTYWLLSIMPKILVILVKSQMERSVSVRSNQTIQDHLWRWPTLIGQTGPTKICCPILTNWFSVLLLFSRFHLCREFAKGIINNGKSHSSWSSLIRKCCSIYLNNSQWSLTRCSVINGIKHPLC